MSKTRSPSTMCLPSSWISNSMTMRSDQEAFEDCPCCSACLVQNSRMSSREYLSVMNARRTVFRDVYRNFAGTDGIRRAIHQADVNAGQVLADDAECDQLCSCKDNDHRG